MLDDGDGFIMILGSKTIDPLCCPHTISHLIRFEKNCLHISLVPLHRLLEGSMLCNNIAG